MGADLDWRQAPAERGHPTRWPGHIRPAKPADTEAAIPLIHASGPEAIEYGFTTRRREAMDFLRFAFADGRGFFGWRVHTVAVAGQEPVGIGAFYSGLQYPFLSLGLVRQILAFYPPAEIPGIIRRILQLQAVMPPPSRHTHYAAHLGIREDMRSQGIGSALLNHHKNLALGLNRRVYALDVSWQNPRAQALYERLGFAPKAEHRFPGPPGKVPHGRRMAMDLARMVEVSPRTDHPG